jgi:hypothetical protein
MPENAQKVIDNYLTACWSDDPRAEKLAEERMEHLRGQFDEATILEWTKQRSELIYGTR